MRIEIHEYNHIQKVNFIMLSIYFFPSSLKVTTQVVNFALLPAVLICE